ncbi:DEAD/DEAH box helicase [Actinomyces sp. 594]|uniref:DEAD/DEAH box helicase n=1 Tax=Actinomyces sp. 594 TaxID=2057793 RepID=UPI001C58457E|nr:DEAD/DEAH box helicase [Actinomyces sp. 594]MBW3068067.1 DEAD/DEAH box helicase [Actinomyces sp. 594]
MSLLLPSLQAERIRRSIVDYLSTNFALTDAEPRRALADFLQDPEQGIFVGPYVRLRLPYLPASARSDALDWDPGLAPYRHQEDAYRRLTTKDGHRPEPTIVTTGTGSGKTEAFLHPVLDHVLRARSQGITGIKALILYPMNALAADQAARLARLLASDPALAGVTAGLYTGDTAQDHSRVTADSLITKRRQLRQSPPDILLTNYKMLDQLLLRPEDRELWRASAASLTYLVLDEFHTYDGAQGTDVAMLLRRLGLALRDLLPGDDPRRQAFDASPLGPVCPVATSATLGDGGDPTRMLAFARDVFGVDMPADAVVLESRANLEQWSVSRRAAIPAGALGEPVRLRNLTGPALQALADLARAGATDPAALLADTVTALYRRPDAASAPDSDSPGAALASPLADPTDPADPFEALPDAPVLAAALHSHPDVVELIRAAEHATALSDLAYRLFGPAPDPETARLALATILAALSAIRAGLNGTPDRSAVGVEVTMWIREVTRVDRALDTRAAFSWSDDAPAPTEDDVPARPAVYCRSCGRSGWGIVLAPTGQGEKHDQSTIRRDHLLGDTRFRALLHAPGEEADYRARLDAGDLSPETRHPGLRWYSVDGRELLTRPPQDADLETREGRFLPVLTLTGDERAVADGSTHDECPSCGATDSIRFLGSAVATLLSVSLTTLFGDDALDDAEKRALIFTDSVQDAAHRAGFVDQRSHTMSLRSALRGALTADMPIDAWADAALDAADASAFDRYRLVPSALAEHERFKPYWDPQATARRRRTARDYVRRRLLFDISLEVGLQSTYGRTLEATGSVTVHVSAGRAGALNRLARAAIGEDGGEQQTLPGFDGVGDRDLLAWVRGTLEHMRRDGAIDHEWLTRYKRDDGKRLWIWYKRNRRQGQPAFPAGRTAPAFPQVGGSLDTRRSAFVPVGSPQSWYATWTRKCLHVTPTHAARFARALLAGLAKAEIVSATTTNTGGTVYGIPAERVIVSPLHDATGEELLLVCDTCRSQLPAAAATVDQLDGAHCLTADCPGTLEARAHQAESFYRDMYAGAHVRRVDAHEHTSLLDSEERAAAEAGFKRPVQRPGDPNVLVATPTLEMGIDIGDLSTVMLGSLPDTVASYVQRVGRAGRRNGSALALAYVPGRREQLPRLKDPASLLDGSVRPPSTYLGAEEILRPQFIAYVIDVLARENHPAVPSGGRSGDARTALSGGDDSFIGAVCERISRDGAILARSFAATFTNRPPALTRLEAWIRHDDGAGPRDMLQRAVAEHRAEAEQLRRQRKQVDDALSELRAATQRPNPTEEDQRALRAAEGTLTAIKARLVDLEQEHWISALERHGVLPNYALIDDTVRLSARVSWRNPENDEFHSEPYDVDRPSAHALSEFAPGATFYTHGMEMGIQGVDGSGLSGQAQWWLCCQACGYVDVRPPQEEVPAAPAQCPRCHDTAIADVGRARRVLRLNRVFADVSKDDARIGDGSEERIRTGFEVLPLADFNPERVKRKWSVSASGFGLVRYRGLTLRWLNTGRALAGQAVDQVASLPVSSRDFRLCEACGKLDTDTGVSSPSEHRPWCEHRTDPKEHVIQVDLMRELTTEAIALVLPVGLVGYREGLTSLASAILLGLELLTGGAPDHLAITSVPYPVADGEAGETRPALLLHDAVPGGTGYLTDFDGPERLWELIVTTGRHLEECPCRGEDAAMCHRCLQPHAVSAGVTRAAALHALRQLLGMDEEELFTDLDPHVPTWAVTDEPVHAGVGESPLEASFRTVLARRLSKTMNVTTVASPSGAPALDLDGGRWRIRPQLDAHGTRPDFTCQRPLGRSPIAVYTDGRGYHASLSHNRLADDAAKRARLRAHGYRVISLGFEDLTDAWEPIWLDDPAVTQLRTGMPRPTRAGAVTEQALTAWRGGPMELLVTMLLDDADGQGPTGTALSALADSVWSPLILGATRHLPLAGGAAMRYAPATSPNNDPLWEALRALRPGSRLPEPTTTSAQTSCSVFVADHLSLAIQLTGTATTGMALVLDDSEEALASPVHAESWRTWLRLSNVLALAQAPVTITTTSLALTELQERAAAEAAVSGSGVPVETMHELGWDAVDTTLMAEEVRALLPHLARAGIARDGEGQEAADGVMTELSWKEQRVAVVYQPLEGDVAVLQAAGWRAVVAGDDPAATAAEVSALLKEH